jgi:predicted nuclease of predicted toxin-antitoxin system
LRLLFDQNISYRIVKKVKELFPESNHVQSVGLNGASDNTIWNFAKKNNFSIVSFDADFIDITLINGFPPKIIWLRIGNSSTNKIYEVLLENKSKIQEFVSDETLFFLEID